MSRNHILYPLSAALAATLALSACKKPEPAAPPPAPRRRGFLRRILDL